MHAPELSLDAAIRDATSPRLAARSKAIRNLAPALLEARGVPGPSWRAADQHDRGTEVIAALRRALGETEDPMLPGLAAVGLGLLGEPDAIEHTQPWLEREGDSTDDIFVRECAVITLSFVGACAPATPEGERVRAAARWRLERALRAKAPDVRFQAGIALVEVAGEDAEAAIVDALEREEHAQVRANHVAALARLDPPGPRACAALRRVVQADPEGTDDAAFEAALALTAARAPDGGPRLVASLHRRTQRDDALEALAVLGRQAPPEAIEQTDRVMRSVWTPGVTRVRAAYALARMLASGRPDAPNPGELMLRRLAWHPRSAVREAVTDARAALRKLGTEP
jgi:HEAT repeat protein